jgi:hypothetical protein
LRQVGHAIAALVVRVDLHLHRQADLQRMLAELCRVRGAIRTGTRCTILIQLPLAFCARRSAKAPPVPAPKPITLP